LPPEEIERLLPHLGRVSFKLGEVIYESGGLRNVHGISLCQQIRASDSRTPIVIFSGHSFASDIEAGMLAGANAYLVKPDSSELIPTIRRLLGAAAA
jgi:DNA-binding response OmpR family regulator